MKKIKKWLKNRRKERLKAKFERADLNLQNTISTNPKASELTDAQIKKIPINADVSGLSSEQVADLKAQGKSNKAPADLTRTTKQIIKSNVFTLFNLINIILSVLVILVGHIENALFLWIVFINTSIGIFQEVRAKKTIDGLSLLTRTKVAVKRDGQLQNIYQEEIVLGDVLYVKSGNQIPSDGKVIYAENLEIDESLLTGEADHIEKKLQDSVMSGSFVAAGKGYIQVTAVGDDNYVSKLSKEAKTEKNHNQN